MSWRAFRELTIRLTGAWHCLRGRSMFFKLITDDTINIRADSGPIVFVDCHYKAD